jgi:hypothetical protein
VDRTLSSWRLLYSLCTLTFATMHSNWSCFRACRFVFIVRRIAQWLVPLYAHYISLGVATVLKHTSSTTYVIFTVNLNSKFAVRISIERRTGLTTFLSILKSRYLDMLLKKHRHDSSKTIHNDSINSAQDMRLNNKEIHALLNWQEVCYIKIRWPVC